MNFVRIPKRNGTWRTVCVPDPTLKARLRARLGYLEAKARKACPTSVCHGFTRMRSPVTNALAHVGYAYTVVMDLKDFFDSITPQMLSKKMTKEELADCLIDPCDGLGPRPLQGLPTSPAVANLAAADMDKAILKAIEKAKHHIVYTRYADDLTFSFNDQALKNWVMQEIPIIVSRCGFRIAPQKTHFMIARAGRRHITGVAVDDTGIYPTRKLKRKLRAALHQGRENHASGLAEWAKLKLPKQRPIEPPPDIDWLILWQQRAAEVKVLTKIWRLKKLPMFPEPKREWEVAEGNFIITRDPVYILGMSTYTTGWRSCMAQPDGRFRQGVATWYALAGTSVAALLSTSTVTYGGVTRRAMQARALVHHFRNGQIAYDRIYGDSNSCYTLMQWFEAKGIAPIAAVPSGSRVVGNVPATVKQPYCDSLKPVLMHTKDAQVWVLMK